MREVLLAQTTPAPVFLEEPADQEVNPGDTADLKCRLNQPVTVIWLKDGNIQNVGNGGVYTYVGDSATSNEHTIRISGITVDRDDGVWECQALIPGTTGALRSRKARLVVRVPPRDRPSLQLGGSPLRNGDDLQVRSDLNATVACIARDSNPPASLKWWIGTKDVTDSAATINQTSQGGKLYNTVSTLTYQFMPLDNGGQLKCEINHPALAGSLSSYAHLNVLYAPIVTVEQNPTGDLLEGQDVTLSCYAPANPPSTVKWYHDGAELPMINSSSFSLEKITHEVNGNYTCMARNPGFEPVRTVYQLGVRYSPTFIVQPHGDTVDLEQQLTLFCDAVGNPTPSIQWFQNTTDGQRLTRGTDRNLSITADYSSQGKYWCRASNTINDKENIVLSDVAELFVKGPPKFDTTSGNQRNEVIADRGSDSILSAVYCSQPVPTNEYWQREQRPNEKPKPIVPISSNSPKYQIYRKELSRPGCYESRLKVLQVDQTDAGRYKLWVENEKGSSTNLVVLSVREASYTSVIVGVVVGVGSALILAIVAVFCCYRTKRFCFASKKSFSNGDVEKREMKVENGEMVRSVQKDDNLKQNPLQTESIFTRTEKKANGNANGGVHHVISNGNDLPKKSANGRVDERPAEVLHYAQLDVDGPMDDERSTPRMDRERHDNHNGYTDIRPTVL
ncbi:putative Kin of IRRE-like protein 1 [Hypsibius exemplaris]|uniref:Kin of IRRE-like protein 1 n=1 Tax=Hypsibius exemplaris TaxID=2072580 RepID=A0A1W0WK13_HYPEX|nr:putative Kin of IRRE-like protein 1 [Hypsibius exemplaris]